jgi:hypothetical protein
VFIAALRHFMSGGKKVPSTLRALSASDLKQLHDAFADSSLRILVV